MKILQLATFFPPYIGGSENYVLELSKHLRHVGHQVLVVSSRLQNNQSYENIDGVDVVRIPGIHLAQIPYFIFSPELVFTLLRLSDKFDVIHTHVRFFLSTNVAAMMRKLRREIPLVTTLHATRPNIRYAFLRPLEKIYDSVIGKFTINCADHIIALDENVKVHARSFGVYSESFAIIPNGVDTERFNILERISPDPVLVGFIGNLTRRKGVEYLIEGFKIISKKYPVLLKIAGDGPEEEKLRKLCHDSGLKEQVIFLGAVNRENVPEFYKDVDILVVPSLSEGMPTVMLEGMACGKAVIVTDVGAVSTVLSSEKVGLMIPPKDPGSIARAMASLIEDEKLRVVMGNRARMHIENYFSWEKITTDIELVYQKAIGCFPV
ncbi:glycosyltransferase [Candidatus Poribacteria bacterium]|nr:glycosyltransferase [Candidatus Poribacteria bacterium]